MYFDYINIIDYYYQNTVFILFYYNFVYYNINIID